MDATLDRFGRIVIPKKVRDNLDLGPGSQMRIEEIDNGIVLKPVHGEPNLIEKDGVLVFSGVSLGNIEDTLAKHRMDRSNAVGERREGSV